MSLTFVDPARVTRKRNERSITADWVVRDDGDSSQVAQLCVMHYSNSRAYIATLYRVRESGDEGSRTQLIAVTQGVRVGQEHASRFNATTLDSFYERTIMGMREAVTRNERIAAIFDPTGEDV